MKLTERSQAIKAGMREAEAAGKHIGRPEGSSKTAAKVVADYLEVAEVLGEGLSLRAVATRCGVSVNTVRKVKAALADLGRLENERRAAPSSSLPLRFTAAYICDWRRVNGKEGELLQCGHFVSHKGENLDEAKARRCRRCAQQKEKGGPLYAVSLLHRPNNTRKNDLHVTYYRPALVHAESEAHALASVRKAVGWRTLPEGSEAWRVEDPKTVGADTLSPRTVKALALLEANRVLVWKGWGAYILICRGYYDEALNLVRSMGEIFNLVALSVVDKAALQEWINSDTRTRVKKFSPAKIRRRLEQNTNQVMYLDKDWYSKFCENYTHVHPKTRPNLHVQTSRGQGGVGGFVQQEGMKVAIGELTNVITPTAMYIGKYADFDDLIEELGQTINSLKS